MTKLALLAGSAALTLVAATAVAQGSTVDVRAAMQNAINPAIASIWDVSNNAVSDDGGIDTALMDDAKWEQIAAGADRLAAEAQVMAQGTSFIAASPDNYAVSDDAVPMAAVQKHLDADPEGFAELAAGLVEHSKKLAAAARAKDAATASQLVGEMDGVCETCHARYWYPEQ